MIWIYIIGAIVSFIFGSILLLADTVDKKQKVTVGDCLYIFFITAFFSILWPAAAIVFGISFLEDNSHNWVVWRRK